VTEVKTLWYHGRQKNEELSNSVKNAIIPASDIEVYESISEKANYSKDQEVKPEIFRSKGNVAAEVIYQ